MDPSVGGLIGELPENVVVAGSVTERAARPEEVLLWGGGLSE